MRRLLFIVILLCSFLTVSQATADSLVFTLVIDDNPLDWCSLEMSSPMTINRGASFYLKAIISEPELTGQTGASDAISAQFGYSQTDNDPSENNWTWIDADFWNDTDSGDTYWKDIGVVLTETGTYYLACRFSLPDGKISYGGIGGFWDRTNYPSMELTVVDSSLAIADAALPTKFKVYAPYPNPFNGLVKLKIDLPENDRIDLKIFNIRGETVYTKEQFYDAGSALLTLNFNTHPTGMYIAVIRSKFGVYREKMLLIK